MTARQILILETIKRNHQSLKALKESLARDRHRYIDSYEYYSFVDENKQDERLMLADQIADRNNGIH